MKMRLYQIVARFQAIFILLFVRRTDVQNMMARCILNIIYYISCEKIFSTVHRVDLCYRFLLKSNNHVQKLSTIEEINVLVDREK
jgi:hypothetical protein